MMLIGDELAAAILAEIDQIRIDLEGDLNYFLHEETINDKIVYSIKEIVRN